MITVAMVYKSGGDYCASDAVKLARAVHRNLTVPHKIVCLTDDVAIESKFAIVEWTLMPLTADLPGWWSKMELFKIHGSVLYFDLDTIITGNIDALAQWVINLGSKDLLMLRGFYKQDQCSGIMGWNGDVSWIFYRFITQKTQFTHRHSAIVMQCGRHMYRGDQEWLRAIVMPQLNVTFAQDVQPGIVSYKVNLQNKTYALIAEGISIICFHGKPRPCEVNPKPQWLEQHWSLCNG